MPSLRLWTVAILLVVALPAAAENSRAPLRRFALVAGANDGGADRVHLRHAGSDATRVARVLEELGGVHPGDRILLVDPDRLGLQGGLADIQSRLDQARLANERTEFFFYYSGHSDEAGLLLGEERFAYEELRAALDGLGADVRVAIVDSCASGALTRRKGGVRRPPFLLDEASQVKGHAFLTSASAEEAAQESDLIGASFFTHYLLSGLRGAADTSRDGKVTLNEAYQFAFAETLARTTHTSAGAQHPAYEMHLAGRGDLVMTDLRSTSAALVIDEAIAGRIYVRDAEGTLVVELRKERAAPPVELGLAPGPYTVVVDDRGDRGEAHLVLAPDRQARLEPALLERVEGEATRLRGGPAPEDDEWVTAPFVLGLAPGASTLPEGVPADRVEAQVALNLIGGRTGRLDGMAVGLGLNWITDRAAGAMFAGGANLVDGEMEGAQFSTFFNHVEGVLDGAQFSAGYNGAGDGGTLAQFATGANWAGGPMSGLQATAGANFASGFMDGAQLAAGLNHASTAASGFQGAAGVNWVGGRMDGAQIAAGANLADRTDGWQVAGGVNVASGGVRGMQIAGGLSLARDVDGGQISVVNIGRAIDGAQVGVVNVATGAVSGTQIGVFNYADEVDAPIGLINVVRKGRYHLALWADETSPGNLGLKLGGKHIYTLLTAGTSAREGADGRLRWVAGAGLGGHVELGWTPVDFLEIELLTRQVAYGDTFQPAGGFHQISSLRLGAGWQLAPRLALIGGPTLNVSVSDVEGSRDGFGPFGKTAVLHDGDQKLVRLWPGFFLGLQI